ncbi:MAG: T9SS type A sorting domain-containing protein [Chitinophagales bacterium]
MRWLLLLLFPGLLFSQKTLINTIPVTRNGDTLMNAWTGGMNSPVFSTVDWNNDGIKDLLAYDKFGWRPIPFLNDGSHQMPFHFAPQYTKAIPPLLDWMVMRDFNKDGVDDIFAYGPNSAIQCYKGTRTANGITYSLYIPQLQFTDGTFWSRIWTFFDDMPGFVDVDRDGDLDLLVFSISGGTTVEYYQNLSVDSGYGLDSLKFQIADYCWGKFIENALNRNMALGACKRGGMETPNSAGRHQGGSMYTFDYEGDHDVDVLIGDISYNYLTYLHNGGDSANANMDSQDTIFPVYDTLVNLALMPAAYDIDADNDGRNDLLIAPFYASGFGQIQDTGNVWFYKNKGLSNNQYALQSKNFLANTQIDLGTDAKPVFFDYNGDSLLDMVVGNYGYYSPFVQPVGQLALYINNGNDSLPLFTERSLNWSNIKTYGWSATHPAFGDLDGDGRADMVIGEQSGKVHFFKNAGAATASFPSVTSTYFGGIDVGEFATPTIFDLNNDSLPDLIIGDKLGRIHYFPNIGNRTHPLFNNDTTNAFLGNIRVNEAATGNQNGYAAPFIHREGNQTYLYTGCLRGLIYKFLVNSDSLRGGSFLLIDSNILKERIGFRSTVNIADLNGDGAMDYLTGNSRGGIMLYSDSTWSRDTTAVINGILPAEDGDLLLFPNPTKQLVHLRQLGNAAIAQVEITNVIGATVYRQELTTFDTIIPVADWDAGIYIVQVRTTSGGLRTLRFCKQ